MPIIIVRVLYHSKTVFGLPVNEDTNVGDFFNDVVVNELKTESYGKKIVLYILVTQKRVKRKK
jgi:hypothetical protein